MGTESRITHQDPEHRYDLPNISSAMFMAEVMHDRSLPLAIRMDAACKLLAIYPDESFVPRLTYIIPDQPSLATTPGPRASDGPLGKHSHFSATSHITPSHSREAKAPVNIETNTDPSSFDPDLEPPIDYSIPPSPAEIAEIKAAVHALRPDFDPSDIPDPHLCPCGHWIVGEYDCCRALASRDPSKMN